MLVCSPMTAKRHVEKNIAGKGFGGGFVSTLLVTVIL